MKLVITIDDDIYDDYLKQGATIPKYGTAINSLYKALWNGVPLPEHHGRLIDISEYEKYFNTAITYDDGNHSHVVYTNIIPTIIEGSDSE